MCNFHPSSCTLFFTRFVRGKRQVTPMTRHPLTGASATILFVAAPELYKPVCCDSPKCTVAKPFITYMRLRPSHCYLHVGSRIERRSLTNWWRCPMCSTWDPSCRATKVSVARSYGVSAAVLGYGSQRGGTETPEHYCTI